MIETSRSSLKAELQALVDRGQFKSRDQLKSYIAERGWEMTREGGHYISVKTHFKTSFRIRFWGQPDLIVAVDPKLLGYRSSSKIHAVYLLFAYKKGEVPCGYVGSALNLTKRLLQHRAKNSSKRGSWELKEWAFANDLPIMVRVLDLVPRGEAAHLIEGIWTIKLQKIGFVLPGVERWHAARNLSRDFLIKASGEWLPTIEETCIGVPMEDVVSGAAKVSLPAVRSPIHLLVLFGKK